MPEVVWALTPGSVIHYRDGDKWIACRVLALGSEAQLPFVWSLRRLRDGQRLLLDRKGQLQEVPG